MRKKEVRWISRDGDKNAVYAIWREHPEQDADETWHHDNGAVSVRRCHEFLGIELRPGKIAKITIERQY